jgi:hypothetical protein
MSGFSPRFLSYSTGESPIFSGLGTGVFSENALLRERLASNAAMAGQNQFNELTYNQNIVVTVPGNTRFYVVLEKGTAPAGSSAAERASSVAQATTRISTPSLQELRELLELKREMSQMYEQAGPSTAGHGRASRAVIRSLAFDR